MNKVKQTSTQTWPDDFASAPWFVAAWLFFGRAACFDAQVFGQARLFKGARKVLIHHAVDVPLVISEEHPLWRFSLRHIGQALYPQILHWKAHPDSKWTGSLRTLSLSTAHFN